MKYTVVIALLLSVFAEPVQGSYLTELVQLFSRSKDDAVTVDDTTPSSAADDELESSKSKAAKSDSPDAKAEKKALKSINDTKVSEDSLKAAKDALNKTAAS